MTIRFLRTLAVSLFALASLAACDSPIDPGSHPAGVVILNVSGQEVASYLDRGRVVTGSLQVGAGETATYRVRVLDEDGEILDIDGAEFQIRSPTVVTGLRATISIQGNDQLVIVGQQAGPTTIRFLLFHGGHAEFEVQDIPLTVS